MEKNVETQRVSATVVCLFVHYRCFLFAFYLFLVWYILWRKMMSLVDVCLFFIFVFLRMFIICCLVYSVEKNEDAGICLFVFNFCVSLNVYYLLFRIFCGEK